MKIYCLNNNTGSRFYRVIPQLREMQRLGHEVYIGTVEDEYITQRIDWADVVIFQMVFSDKLVKYAKAKKKKTVFECDDLLHIVPPTHYAYEGTRGLKNRIDWWKKIIMTIGRCDAFISTNKLLDRKYGKLVKKSLVFPNYCFLEHWLKEYKPNTTDRVRMLWAGSTSHTGDLEAMKKLITEVLLEHPEVQFIYMGMGGIKSEDPNAQFIYGEDFWKGLPDNRESILPVPANVYPYVLSGLMADFAIAPLEKNYFNRFKSECKYLEYSVNKIPAIYSGWFYKNSKEGLKADNWSEWKKQIERLIKYKGERLEIGEKAYKDVIDNHNINDHLPIWVKFIENL